MTSIHKQNSPRFQSLDVFRGMTMVLMIMVNSPGNLTPYQWLAHSEWNGCTLADLVFPFFIVIVGISSVLALSNLQAKGVSSRLIYQKIVKRTLYIFAVGLLLNAFPSHFDWHTIRILGVLQRIAICYCCSAFLFLMTRVQTQAAVMVALLIGYACLQNGMGMFGDTDYLLSLEGNRVGFLDRLIFAPGHLYTSTFDPEGLLSTLPAIASVLLGNLIGYCLIEKRGQQVQWFLAAGVLLLTLGWIWSFALPFNKALWSSSYVLWTGGLALLVYALVFAWIEEKHITWWSPAFSLLGRYAMSVYILHVLFLKIQAMIHMQLASGVVVGLRLYITDVCFGRLTPQNASLCYSIAYTLLWLFVVMAVETVRRNLPLNLFSYKILKSRVDGL